ncbi:MAG: hypothetical protein KBD17_01220 [Candidatus Pacebacteria bacterium]|nr:hypothetical protein [Candidatus Paceibacterota bacterium]
MKYLSEKQKFVYTGLLAICTVLSVALFHNNNLLNISVLILCSILMVKVDGDKNVVRLFVAGFILGPLSEAICIYFGAWQYADTLVLGFPVYLPFVWGNAALLFKRLTFYTE